MKFKYLGAFIQRNQSNTSDVELNSIEFKWWFSEFVEMSSLLQNMKTNLRTKNYQVNEPEVLSLLKTRID